MSAAKINWRDHFMEFVIVTLGIIIAFALNNWNENRNEKKLVRLYLEGIKEELVANKAELDRVYPYHLELLKTLEETPMEANLVLAPGEITNSAWRLAENPTFKKHIDPKVYKELSAVYKMHDYLLKESSNTGQLMNESNVLGTFHLLTTMDMELKQEDWQEIEIKIKQGWIPIFETWTSMEKEYLEQIEAALEELGK